MAYYLLFCQVVLLLIFLVSAISKLAYPQQFYMAIQTSRLPKSLTHLTVILTIIAELELAISLALNTAWSLPITFLGILFLLSAFTVWLITIYWKKTSVQCGCFGKSTSNVNGRSIIRNFLLMGIAALGFFLARSHINLFPSFPVWIFSIHCGVAIVIFFFLSKRLRDNPHLPLGNLS